MKPDSKKLTLHRLPLESHSPEPITLLPTDSRQSTTNIRFGGRTTAPIWCFRSDDEPALVAASAPDQRRDKEVTCHDQS